MKSIFCIIFLEANSSLTVCMCVYMCCHDPHVCPVEIICFVFFIIFSYLFFNPQYFLLCNSVPQWNALNEFLVTMDLDSVALPIKEFCDVVLLII